MSDEEGQPGREDEARQEDERLIKFKQNLTQAIPNIEDFRTLSDEDIEVKVTIRGRVSRSRLLSDAVPQERTEREFFHNKDGNDLFCCSVRM
jgi:hypothetical protein